jgi:hypothetical protein
VNASLRDLGERAGAVPAPQLDVAALVAAGEARLRRRRALAVAAVAAVVVAVLSFALVVAPANRRAAPPAGGDRTRATDGDTVETRPAARSLTYSVDGVIHWGDRTIDVQERAHVPKPLGLDYLDVTDDGVVFVTGPRAHRDHGEVVIGNGASAVWFTNGATPVRIGTTTGSRVRGFGMATSLSGSLLAWKEPGSSSQNIGSPSGQVVVYDTARMQEVARFGGAHAFPLELVYEDEVPWVPDARSCTVAGVGNGPVVDCRRRAVVMLFDVATGTQTATTWADYLAERRSRPGLVSTPEGDWTYGHLVAQGRRIVVAGQDSDPVLSATVSATGQPLRLRLPAGRRYPEGLDIAQWLDADRVVLSGVRPYAPACSRRPGGCTWTHDDPDLLVCRLSTGGCRFVLRLPDNRNTLAGQHGGRG